MHVEPHVLVWPPRQALVLLVRGVGGHVVLRVNRALAGPVEELLGGLLLLCRVARHAGVLLEPHVAHVVAGLLAHTLGEVVDPRGRLGLARVALHGRIVGPAHVGAHLVAVALGP